MATWLAAQRSNLGALILVSPFCSIRDVAKDFLFKSKFAFLKLFGVMKSPILLPNLIVL